MCLESKELGRRSHGRIRFKHMRESLCLSIISVSADGSFGYRHLPSTGGGFTAASVHLVEVFCTGHRLSPLDDGKTGISFVINSPHRFVPHLCPWWSREHSGSLQADAISPKTLLK